MADLRQMGIPSGLVGAGWWVRKNSSYERVRTMK